jgi:DNA/RNA-binding domain of Phe-tRNA-synthetase-like protein
MSIDTAEALAAAEISDHVITQHPSYRAVLIGVEGVTGGPSTALSESLLVRAEQHIAARLDNQPLEDWTEFQAWRDAFQSFGVKPRVARSSAEALVRRASGGLPRIDVLTDIYNAVSVLHCVPIGGEDLDHYAGPPRLVIADGTEPCDMVESGEIVNSSPAPGEIVWRDDKGVTCRRWNWRQGVRTRLTDTTTRILFILDGIGDDVDARITAAADELSDAIQSQWPAATVTRRVLPD